MEMLSCPLDRNNGFPLYEQLYAYIKKEIAQGRIEYGTKLPSKRKLSEYLKISQNTIETAYEQLVAEGYIEGVPRKGYFVQAFEDLEYIQSPSHPIKKVEKSEKKIKYNFHPGWIDTKNFPFSKWRRYLKNTMINENHSLLLLGNVQGDIEFREEIAKYLYHARGVQCSPEQIMIGAGSDILLQHLMQVFQNNTIYGVEDPGYHVISHLLKREKREVFPLEVDEEGVRVDPLMQSGVNVVYVTPSHHFPYGSVLSVNRRNKLLSWAMKDDNRYVIEDDYDSEFRYSGKSIPSLQSMDKGDKVIYLGSFSKSLIPSMRISYMVIPKRLLAQFKQAVSFYSCSVSRMDQYVLTQFMKNGDFERHLNRMRKIYRDKMERTLDAIKPFDEKIKPIGEHSGLHIVLEIENGMSEQQLLNKAEENQIKVYPLSSYLLDKRKENPPRIILGFAGISEEHLEEAIRSLLKSWDIL
ncbi:PLP-dependent aminotransferase family protein [Oceanobacillus piezotolerans]|uniref:PLP-dependent aminotransferase family protein n=1 Tax=Oceanobacillus piezotolerans TaxID=2448030 RepID=A0A498D688_9BACI|nr:PLP-dependent aminotransferase family protein [Oceanobacillus piezotolerans]RLL40399.1 PLP-dependent aminotransferase family protein [Oceanobacillus piezotolerans]